MPTHTAPVEPGHSLSEIRALPATQKPPNPRWPRTGCFAAALFVLWFGVLLGAAELHARVSVGEVRETRAADAAAAYGARRAAEDAWIAAHHPLPPEPAPQEPPPREGVLAQSAEGRAALAAARGELLLVCDNEGRIYEVHAAALEPEVQPLAARLSPGMALPDLLEGTQRADLRAALANPATTVQSRWYTIAPPGQTEQVFEWEIHRDPGHTHDQLAVFIANSAWRVMGQEFRPNAYAPRFAGYDELRVNSLGFRDREITAARPPGVYRIVCLGGSTTAEGRRNDLTYPKLLERRLRARLGTDAIEVINAGVYALNSTGELARIEAIMALEPNLVLHYNFINDTNIVFDRAFRPGNLLRDVLLPLRALAWRSEFGRLRHADFLLPAPAALDHALDGWTLAHLRSLGDRVHSGGAAFAVCSFDYPRLDGLPPTDRDFFEEQAPRSLGERSIPLPGYVALVEHYNARVRQLCAEHGWTYLAVAESTADDPNVFTDLCHMTAEGLDQRAAVLEELLADAIARGLGAN